MSVLLLTGSWSLGSEIESAMEQSGRNRESVFSEVASRLWAVLAGPGRCGDFGGRWVSLAGYRAETRREVTPAVIMAAGDRWRERFLTACGGTMLI